MYGWPRIAHRLDVKRNDLQESILRSLNMASISSAGKYCKPTGFSSPLAVKESMILLMDSMMIEG